MSKPEFSKPFNVEHARAGAPYGYESGEIAEIIKWDRGDSDRFPLVVLRSENQNVEVRNLQGDDGGDNCNRLVMLPLGMIEGKPVFVDEEIVLKSGGDPIKAMPMRRDFSRFTWPAPAKAYPVTQMTQTECEDAWAGAGLMSVANAALRHAVDNGYLLTPEEAKNRTHEHYQRGLGERATRDMAIAEAVRNYIAKSWALADHPACNRYCHSIDLSNIIASVPK